MDANSILERDSSMNLTELQKEAHAIAKEKGWWDQERTFGDLIALIHSELSEALEAYRKTGWPWLRVNEWRCDVHGEPMGVASELADVVIRVADMAEWYGLSFPIHLLHINNTRSFGDWIAECHSSVSEVLATFKRFPANPELICGSLWGLLGHVFSMAAHYDIDLDAAIAAKMEYNRTRQYRHGGKAL